MLDRFSDQALGFAGLADVGDDGKQLRPGRRPNFGCRLIQQFLAPGT